MAAAATDRVYEGQGRPRKKKIAKTDLPSHYQFAHWAYDDGKRFAVPVGGVRKDKRSEFSLISTTILNEGTGTETLIWLHFDLDFKRALKKWIRDGKLDWPTIAAALSADAPIILRYLSHVVRSSGGHGLSLALAISPLELIDETADVQKLAFKVQDMIIRILNHHGMGADEGARGLKRLMPNMFRQERVLDQADFVLAMIQKHRPAVLRNLVRELQNHVALRGKLKSEREDVLWPDIRVEKALARLYTDLLDSVGPWGSEQMKAADLTGRYGMGKNTAYKLLADPPRWLGVEKVSGEGYRLTIRPDVVLTSRALDLLLDEPERKAFNFSGITAPEFVQKGERNRWLVSLILASKWSGIGQQEVRKALDLVIRRVPGWQKSQSLTRGLGATLRSLYRNRNSLKGRNRGQEQPAFWVEALESLKSRNISSKKHKKASLDATHPGRNSGMITQSDQEARVLPFEAPFSPTPVGVTPGVRGGPGPWVDGDSRIPGLKHTAGVTRPSAFHSAESARKDDVTVSPVFSAEVHTGHPEIYPADRAVFEPTTPDPGPESNVAARPRVGDFVHLSGSALSSAFSKLLMRSQLSAAEKVRILTEATSITERDAKDRLRREWLVRLQKT
ncbi:hypothetical protein [Oligoflexus sp.]|uniref:hypothetical protein n=1 Tax=Oligoflexus sp. TaxID=1971216 RepID=UPI002D78DC69|nr:hypothetical protein [Oligoflexus sp.]